MPYLFTSESVSEGHPDKVADQISDAVLDAMLSQDPHSRVACETLVTTGLVVLAGEITTRAHVDLQKIVRDTITRIGYTSDEYQFSANSCAILSAIHEQSPDIARGVDSSSEKEQGAGDQGMMFGYATNETEEYMPAALAYSHRLVHELARIRKEEPQLMPYLRPDAKSQVTIEYNDDGTPHCVHTIVVSTQHDEFVKPGHLSQFEADHQMLERIRQDVINILVPRVIPAHLLKDTIYHINPTGKFVIGGPHGDSGLTGRKIIVDTYGGKGAHGGGAFSGKDPSKVDRSAAYAARHIAKNLVAAGVADEVLVQLAYAIGVAEPVSINVNTYGRSHVSISDAQIAELIGKQLSFTPRAIVERLGLKNPVYSLTAAYGHMGRESYEADIDVVDIVEAGDTRQMKQGKRKVTFFAWERLDLVPMLKETFAPYMKEQPVSVN
jgi:S-adenosylmethionine synthetase